MLRQTLMAALAIGATMTSLPRAAEAVYNYTLADQVYGVIGNRPPDRAQRTGFSFSVSDAAVARGSFDFTFAGNFGRDVFFSGDVADFVSFSALDQTVAQGRSFLVGVSTLNVTFGAGGNVNSLALAYRGDTEQLFLNPTGAGLVAGTYGSDFNNCGASQTQCTVSGRIATVPEPMSLALLGVGLLGMTVLARRQF